jgi:acetoin utilization deacetylase AcuC-like enzyme
MPRALCRSLFRHSFFAHSGAGSRCSNLLVPSLPRGTGSAAFLEASAETGFAPLDCFAPEPVILSAGVDSHVLKELPGLSRRMEESRFSPPRA